MGWIMIIVLLAVLAWLFFSFKIIGPEEMAIKVIFGTPVSFCDSGWVFDLRLPLSMAEGFKCFVKKYPKKIYNFNYKWNEVITAAGECEGVQYYAQTLRVNAAAYLSFPQKEGSAKKLKENHPLVKILRAGIPIEEEKLKNWVEEAVISALRSVFGQITWAKAIKETEETNRIVSESFKKNNSALIRAGFGEEDIGLVVTEIKLPPSVEKALTRPDRAKLEADAALHEATQRATKISGAVIETFCAFTGMSREEVGESLKDDAEGFIKKNKDLWERSWDMVCRKMGIDGGSYIDIRTGNSLQDLFSLIAFASRMPMGGGSKEKEGKQGKKVRDLPKKEIFKRMKKFKQQGGGNISELLEQDVQEEYDEDDEEENE